MSVGCLVLLGLTPQQSVPVHEEPRHHLVLENEAAYVLDVQIPAGDTTLYHTHADPIFYVSIATSRTRSQSIDRQWMGPGTGPVRSPGWAMSNIRYVDRPVTHRINNVGDGLFRLIAVVNRSHGADAHSAAAGAQAPVLPAGLETEVDNHFFRSFRIELQPGESHGPHRHADPVVVVDVASGDWRFHDAGAEHTLTQSGDGPLELVEIEIR